MAVSNAHTAIVEEARKLAVDVLYSEKGHFAAATVWRRVHYGIGVPSALLAAAAGGTALSEGSVDARVVAALALCATLLSALNTFLNPNEKAGQHHRSGVEYGRTRRKVRQVVQIESFLDSPEALRAKLAELTDDVGRLQAEAPPLFKLAHWMAGRQIAGGSADYTAAELEAAAGAAPLGARS